MIAQYDDRDGPLPDTATLNKAIPVKLWEDGLDGQPRPPWGLFHVIHLLDPRDAGVLTYTNSTVGARIAWERVVIASAECVCSAGRR